jgi:hypothetical protein
MRKNFPKYAKRERERENVRLLRTDLIKKTFNTTRFELTMMDEE